MKKTRKKQCSDERELQSSDLPRGSVMDNNLDVSVYRSTYKRAIKS